MIEIIPAVLPKSFEGLEAGLARLHGVAPLVQIDLVQTNVLEGQESIPFWEEFDFEADVMLPNPSSVVGGCIQAGASRIVVHASAKDAREALQLLQDTREGDFAVAVGIALAAHDMPEALKPFDGLYDYVQVMGIDHIGKQGEPPDPHHHEVMLIAQLRSLYPNLIIQVDGAAAAHVAELVKAGANRLVVGSAILTADNPLEEFQRLYNVANARS
jgi:pentose-5-phosphate-3-epimerase